MTPVVHSKCPYCDRSLRIPAEWLSRPMKCKHCQQVFVTRATAPALQPASMVAGMPLPPPVLSPPPVAPLSLGNKSSGFNDEPLASAALPRRRRGRRGWMVGTLVGLVLLGIAAGAVVLAWPELQKALKKDKDEDDKDKIAELKDKQFPPADKDKKTSAKTKDDAKPPNDKDTRSASGRDVFPRRALLINVSNYLLFNPLDYGSDRDGNYPGSSTAVLADQLTRPPMNIPPNQITELADGARKPLSTTKPQIEAALSEFVQTSRPQDRIVILFTGHAIDMEKQAYLVPVEGNREKPDTLIPLAWVYEQLAKCPARQKLLVLDVFRFPPARGEELPGAGEMPGDFDAKLHNPPAGIQVWTACSKGQQSLEFEKGSLFLQALCNSLQERGKGITEPTASLPLDLLVTKVNQRLKDVLGAKKLEQVSQVYGKEPDEGAAFDPSQDLPPKLTLKPPSAGAQTLVRNILEEINIIPSPRGSRQPINLASLPAFTGMSPDEYKADYKSPKELMAMAKDKEKYPLRAAYFEVQKILKESEKIRVKEFFPSPGGPASPQLKKNIAREQQPVGVMQFELKNALDQLVKAGEQRDKENSKRWQINFDLAVARLKARLVYLNEYNEILAKVRGDSLPDLAPGDTGFRVGSSVKLSTKESEYKKMEKEVKKSLVAIARDHPNTPWAIVAQRESMTALGLMWRPTRE
ncbi:MAG: caspase family protein [Planctomycetes bacterium]|nr:caspase family protein [Planctomycetota bacterium]